MSSRPREPITSAQNPRFRTATRLRDRRDRTRRQQFLIDGARETRRAIAAHIRIAELFVCESLCTDEARQVIDEALLQKAERVDLAPELFTRLAFGDRAEGIVAVAKSPSRTLGDLPNFDNPLIAVIEGVEKPGNLGAIFRTADAAGISGVIVADGRADLFNPNAIRASLGTIFSVPAAVATTEETVQWLGDHGVRTFAARVDGSIEYTAADYRGSSAILLGSEAQGLSNEWDRINPTNVRLPMRGAADSLNVSVAAAVLFYEARRQRR